MEDTWGSIAASVLAANGDSARLARLRSSRNEFSRELVGEFRRSAGSELRKDPNEAESRARLGLTVAFAIGDDEGEVACLRVAAQAAILSGGFTRALDALDRAREVPHIAENDLHLAQLDAVRIGALIQLDRYAEAEETARRVLHTFEAQGDEAGVIRIRMALADLAFRLDRPREALRHYARVEADLPAEASASLRGAIAGNRANCLEALNRFRAAARHFDMARQLFTEAGADHAVAQVDYNAAYAEMLRGNYSEALRRYSATEEVFRELGDERHLALIDLDRAEIHLHLNFPQEVMDLAVGAERRFLSIGMEKEAAQAAHLAGCAAELTGDTEEAERLLERAERSFARLGLAERRLKCRVQRASVAETAGQFELATRLTDQAELLLGKGMNPLSKASLELLRARRELRHGDPEDALQRAAEVSRNCRRIHAPWVQIEARWIVALAHRRCDRPTRAILAYKAAIDHLERYRGGVPPDEYMTAFLSGRAALYEELVALLVESGDTDTAFEYAERAKSRALVELLAGREKGSPSGTDRALPRRLRHLRDRLRAIYQRLFRADGDGDERSARVSRETRRQAAEVEQEFARLLRDLRLRDREASSLVEVDAPESATVRGDLAPGTMLLEYFLTPDALFTFAVNRESTHVVRREVSEGEVLRLIETFYFHVEEEQHPRSAPEELVLRSTRANLEELSRLLLDPIAEDLQGTRLVVVPHGVLHHLPFHALPWEDGWIADRFEVVCAPSAAVYGFCGSPREPAPGLPAVFGVPDEEAPRIEEEAIRVAQLLRSDRLFLGDRATLAELTGAARDARILHLATHGMFRHAQPMLSAIRLADGWMNIYDLYDLEVGGDLVVLATCESGTANVTGGDEVLGLSRAFLYAGARALLTSLWRVNDIVTAEFMDDFYRGLEASGDAAAAHRQAMAAARGRYPHPYYWAPFVLTGRPAAGRQVGRGKRESDSETCLPGGGRKGEGAES